VLEKKNWFLKTSGLEGDGRSAQGEGGLSRKSYPRKLRWHGSAKKGKMVIQQSAKGGDRSSRMPTEGPYQDEKKPRGSGSGIIKAKKV